MKLLGFYVAEGSCSDRNGIQWAIGKRNRDVLPEMKAALEDAFGLDATVFFPDDAQRAGELKLVNRVAALAWQHLFGFNGETAST
jgi:DNA gyrase subunit B